MLGQDPHSESRRGSPSATASEMRGPALHPTPTASRLRRDTVQPQQGYLPPGSCPPTNTKQKNPSMTHFPSGYGAFLFPFPGNFSASCRHSLSLILLPFSLQGCPAFSPCVPPRGSGQLCPPAADPVLPLPQAGSPVLAPPCAPPSARSGPR